MTTQERIEMIAIIEKTIAATKQEIVELTERTKPVSPDVSLGRLTRMEAIGEKSVNDALLREAQIRLKKLEYARRRADSKDYGYCDLCDEPIPIGRLKAIPEATLCVVCKEQQG